MEKRKRLTDDELKRLLDATDNARNLVLELRAMSELELEKVAIDIYMNLVATMIHQIENGLIR